MVLSPDNGPRTEGGFIILVAAQQGDAHARPHARAHLALLPTAPGHFAEMERHAS